MARNQFNRSQFMKERWTRAKQNQNLYEDLTGEKLPSKKFLSGEDPLTGSIVAYDVSYQLDYVTSSNKLLINSSDTFRVYAFKPNFYTEDKIVENTRDAIRNAKSPKTGNTFSAPTQDKAMSDNSLKVDLKEFRGMELANLQEVKEDLINNLKVGKGFYVEKKDTDMTVRNKSGYTVKMKGDLTRYFDN